MAQTKAGLRPVGAWNPPARGDIGLKIHWDGTWTYQGGPISRPELVTLFASVLRREPDATYSLVTPAERVPISVEGVPFVAVEMTVRQGAAGDELLFRTNVDDVVVCGPEGRLRFFGDPARDGLIPYLHVRDGLEARCVRPIYYELVERAQACVIDGVEMLAVKSSGVLFPLAPLAGLDEAD